MNIQQTFGFKGHILPIVDKNDKLYIFIKNECDGKILLNFSNLKDINKFIRIDENSIKMIQCGTYDFNTTIKIFYMGCELFEFNTNDIKKLDLLQFSNYIIKNNVDIDKISFNISLINGCKIIAISNKPQQLYIKFVNKLTNEILHEDVFMSGEPYNFNKKYYIDYEISIYNSNGLLIYKYDLNLKNKKVLIRLDSKALGDTLAWIPYVEEFRKKHDCEIYCLTYWNHLFETKYPNINFISYKTIIDQLDISASYTIQCSIPYNIDDSPLDYRDCSLQQIASSILGLPNIELKPLVHDITNNQLIKDNYVVISTMSTAKAKLWNNDTGWQNIIDFLNENGLKVVLLQKENNSNLKNIINYSGNDDIFKAVNLIKYSKFFIGLSSGLSWLAWALNKQVVMISGFTKTKVEFSENNHRVINENVCHGCWNDKDYTFDRENWMWCPKKLKFQCSVEITSDMVKTKINKILKICKMQ